MSVWLVYPLASKRTTLLCGSSYNEAYQLGISRGQLSSNGYSSLLKATMRLSRPDLSRIRTRSPEIHLLTRSVYLLPAYRLYLLELSNSRTNESSSQLHLATLSQDETLLHRNYEILISRI